MKRITLDLNEAIERILRTVKEYKGVKIQKDCNANINSKRNLSEVHKDNCHSLNDILEIFEILEKNQVFISYEAEHYANGSNLIFQIEFRKYNVKTGAYNDNHEFGNVKQTIINSTKLALWYLEDPKRIESINNSRFDSNFVKYREDLYNFLQTITNWD